MFDTENIGMRISELRKAKNMTQMELADHMNISFQAVSNWERGNSMPDISKLPELAELFGVSIDEILGKQSNLINNAVNDNLESYLENNSVTVEELSEAAPILTAKQVDAAIKDIHISSIEEIEEILPFISQDLIVQLAWKAVNEGNYRDLPQIMPFINREAIDKIADTIYHKENLSSIISIAPFISQELRQKIAQEDIKKNNGLHHIVPLAPFLEKDFLNTLAKKAIEKDGIKAISPIVHFLDKNMLSEFIKEQFL